VKSVWLGLGLTAVVTGVLALIFGRDAIIPGLTFGGFATVIQLVAVLLVRPVIEGPTKQLMKRWGFGMALRFLGVALFLVAVLVSRDIFPPLPTAFAYLGVLVPLLFTEIRLIK
jgi:hypothetical protein